MQMYLDKRVGRQDIVTEVKSFGMHCLMLLPGADRIQGLLKSSFLKLLFIPVLFALSTYAADYSDVQSQRAALDPVLRNIKGVEGSMMGVCVQGTDKDPFKEQNRGNQSVDMCLVYFVKDESLIPRIRKALKKLNVNTTVAVRFQKT